MTTQLAQLCVRMGESSLIHRMKGDDEFAKSLMESLSEYVASIPIRPDSERAALMLLSAGQEMYGKNCDTVAASSWEEAFGEAMKLLGIVPLAKAD